MATFTVEQLPILPPETYERPCPWQPSVSLGAWIGGRALELTFTSWDLEHYAVDVGSCTVPFLWDVERRFRLSAELDAAYFHLYGLSRDEASAILETFPVLRRSDERVHGVYRTKNAVLDHYDRMQRASETGAAIEAPIAPPPADLSVRHGPTPWRSVLRIDSRTPAFDARYRGGDDVEIRRHNISDREYGDVTAHLGEPEHEKIGGQLPDGTMWDGVRLRLRGYFEFLARMETLPAPFKATGEVAVEPPWVLAVPSVARAPLAAEQDAMMMVWAALHAAGGKVRHSDLVAAYVLRNAPADLVAHAKDDAVPVARAWATSAATRTPVPGLLRQALEELLARDAVALTTDGDGRAVAASTDQTPAVTALEPWVAFEAKLALRVLAALSTEERRGVLARAASEDTEAPISRTA